eukprot:GHVR01128659.1.p1 GENE.GHVR01128659.1~~GHVR01128659.1.p1  ORF type:complete len:228 (+),score=60.14 GHVR01128659.1:63-686(+)
MTDKIGLIIVDVQNDFCEPSGSLAVKDSLSIIPVINKLKKCPKFDVIILTCDCHPPNHCSFASNHPGQAVYSKKVLDSGVEQVMWPVHCVEGTGGANIHASLDRSPNDIVVKKGKDVNVDSYSGFGTPPEDTGLKAMLKSLCVSTVYVCGLALDYCVGSTAMDASHIGLKTYVVEDAARGVGESSVGEMMVKFKEGGVVCVNSSDVL